MALPDIPTVCTIQKYVFTHSKVSFIDRLCILDPHPLSSPTWKDVLRRSFCCLERLQCPSFPPCGAERARAQAFPSSKSCYLVLGLLGPPAPVLAAPLSSQHPCPEPPLSGTSPCRVPPSPVAYLLFTRGEVYFVIKGQGQCEFLRPLKSR